MGLYDMILVKDNHVDYAGSMAQALENVAAYMKAEQSNVPVVVEVRDADEAAAAMAARTKWQKPDGSPLVDRLLLDNHTRPRRRPWWNNGAAPSRWRRRAASPGQRPGLCRSRRGLREHGVDHAQREGHGF